MVVSRVAAYRLRRARLRRQIMFIVLLCLLLALLLLGSHFLLPSSSGPRGSRAREGTPSREGRAPLSSWRGVDALHRPPPPFLPGIA